MLVQLEAIKFNHDPTFQTTGAFNIRRNETRIVTVPEWQRDSCSNPECSPVAYAISAIPSVITIETSFLTDDQTLTNLKVRALDGHHGSPTNVLGNIPEQDIPLNQGASGYQNICLPDARIANAGVGVSDVVWIWQFLCHGNWIDLEITSHRIYVVLALPTEPWHPKSNNPLDTKLPWTEVMEYACRWAKSETQADKAAARVTRRIYDLGSTPHASGTTVLRYDEPGSGSEHYIFTDTINLDCTRFLERLSGGEGNGPFLNCSDCATVVSSFSNILGGDLWQSQMGYNFPTNEIQKIGLTTPEADSFLYHEVAWKDGCTKDDPLFDACLQVDDVFGPPFTAELPTNVRLGDPSDNDYQSQLAAHNPQGARCVAHPETRLHRIIGRFGLQTRALDPALLSLLRELHNFEDWEDLRTLEQRLFIQNFFFRGDELPGWQPYRSQCWSTKHDLTRTIQTFWRRTESHSPARVCVEVLESASLLAAHALVLKLLGTFQLRDIKRQKAFDIEDKGIVEIGDVCFAGRKEQCFLFARANLVALMRNMGSEAIKLTGLASLFDKAISYKPTHGPDEMTEFYFPERQFGVKECGPLNHVSPERLNPELLYKFFSTSGEIFLLGNQLVYHPEASGKQEVEIFAGDLSAEVRMQKLTLVVT